jgi:hypothetical protein
VTGGRWRDRWREPAWSALNGDFMAEGDAWLLVRLATAGHFISLLRNDLQKRKNVSAAVTST